MPDEIAEKLNRVSDQLEAKNESLIALQLQIDRRIDELHSRIDAKLDTGIDKHRQHIDSLYTNFRQIVMAGLAFLAAGATFLGYQSISAIPAKFDEFVKTNTQQTLKKINDKIEAMEGVVDTKKKKIDEAMNTIEKQQASISEKISTVEGEAKAASSKISTAASIISTNLAQFENDLKAKKAESEQKLLDQIETIIANEKTHAKLNLDKEASEFKKNLNTLVVQKFITDFQSGDRSIAFVLDQYNPDWTDSMVLDTLDVLYERRYSSTITKLISAFLEKVSTRKSEDVTKKMKLVGLKLALDPYLNELKADLSSGNEKKILEALDAYDLMSRGRSISSDPNIRRLKEDLFRLIQSQSDSIRRKAFRLAAAISGWNRADKGSFEEFLQIELKKPDAKLNDIVLALRNNPVSSDLISIVSDRLQDSHIGSDLQGHYFQLGILAIAHMRTDKALEDQRDQLRSIFAAEKKYGELKKAALAANADKENYEKRKEGYRLIALLEGAKPTYEEKIADVGLLALGQSIIRKITLDPTILISEIRFNQREFVLNFASGQKELELNDSGYSIWSAVLPADGRRIVLRLLEQASKDDTANRDAYTFQFFLVRDQNMTTNPNPFPKG